MDEVMDVLREAGLNEEQVAALASGILSGEHDGLKERIKDSLSDEARRQLGLDEN